LPVLTSKDFSGDLPPDLHFPDSDWLTGPRAVALVVVGGGNPTSVAACHIPVGSRLFSSALAASLHWKESFSSRLRLVGIVRFLGSTSARIEWVFLSLSFSSVQRGPRFRRQSTQRERGKERGRGPSIPALELDPAAISGSLMEIRSRAATSGAEATWA